MPLISGFQSISATVIPLSESSGTSSSSLATGGSARSSLQILADRSATAEQFERLVERCDSVAIPRAFGRSSFPLAPPRRADLMPEPGGTGHAAAQPVLIVGLLGRQKRGLEIAARLRLDGERQADEAVHLGVGPKERAGDLAWSRNSYEQNIPSGAVHGPKWEPAAQRVDVDLALAVDDRAASRSGS